MASFSSNDDDGVRTNQVYGIRSDKEQLFRLQNYFPPLQPQIVSQAGTRYTSNIPFIALGTPTVEFNRRVRKKQKYKKRITSIQSASSANTSSTNHSSSSKTSSKSDTSMSMFSSNVARFSKGTYTTSLSMYSQPDLRRTSIFTNTSCLWVSFSTTNVGSQLSNAFSNENSFCALSAQNKLT